MRVGVMVVLGVGEGTYMVKYAPSAGIEKSCSAR